MSGLLNGFNNGRDTTDGIGGQKPIDQIPNVSGSVFTQDEENELQILVRKIKYKQPTIDDMKKSDELTRKKWKAETRISILSKRIYRLEHMYADICEEYGMWSDRAERCGIILKKKLLTS